MVDHVLWYSERKVCGGQNILELKLQSQTLHQLRLAMHSAAFAGHSRPSMLVQIHERLVACIPVEACHQAQGGRLPCML